MFEFLSEKFSSIFSRITGKSHLTEQNIDDAIAKVKESLLEADVPYRLIETFVESVKKEVVGQKVLKSLKPGDQFIKVVHEKIQEFLGGKSSVDFTFQLPSVVMVLGLQGSGKTTSIAKMAHFMINQAQKRGKTRKILFGSVDFYRPAAIDQLEILAGQVGAGFYRSPETNPVKAARDIVNHYKNERYDLLFLDTAGRLHVDTAMVQELKEIVAVVAPKYKVMVLDAMTGQESLGVAKAFNEAVGFDFAVLTKMDSETRAGAAFSFRYELKKPVTFVGTGEKIEDLSLFHPDRMAGRMLGMGDVLTLIEKADEKIKHEEQEAVYNNLVKGRLTLQDFADQMSMMNKMGSLGTIAKMMPGMGGAQLSSTMIEQGEKEMKKFGAILGSMTLKERLIPSILNESRKKRIAGGAGVQVVEINTLLQRFEQMQQYAKLFKKFGHFLR